MMRSSLILRVLPAVLGVSLSVTGCAHAVPTAVARQESRWDAKRPASYDFVYFRDGMAGRCTLSVHVRDGKVASAQMQKRCPFPLDPKSAPTIDGVFSQTKSAYSHDDRVDTSYDPTYGFPTAVSVDPDRHVVDDESGFGVVSFHPTPSVGHTSAPASLTRPATGVVTGLISPCVGAAVAPIRYAAGTAIVYRGVEGTSRVSGGDVAIPPADVAARQHVNENRAFRFVLAPGPYVLSAKYDEPGVPAALLELTVTSGATLRRNVSNLCK